jgi:hypothetical protein
MQSFEAAAAVRSATIACRATTPAAIGGAGDLGPSNSSTYRVEEVVDSVLVGVRYRAAAPGSLRATTAGISVAGAIPAACAA